MPTQRRHLLDDFLNSEIPFMYGDILDIGGKKADKRGQFRPPLHKVSSWLYVNIDQSTKPDFCCSAESIPLPDESIDGFLLCEVLEHLENPEAVIKEIYRLLKPGGRGWITMPFLYQVHADPHDYQRWTNTKLDKVLREVGFSQIKIYPMGGVLAVIHDLWYSTLCRSTKRGSFLNKVGFYLWRYTSTWFRRLDKNFEYTQDYITTGWKLVATK